MKAVRRGSSTQSSCIPAICTAPRSSRRSATRRSSTSIETAQELHRRGGGDPRERGFSTDDVSTSVVLGTPKRVILDEAEEWKADLIVVGSHGDGPIKRFLIGSVSLAVAMHAPCSVRVVRPRYEDDDED
ncbi:MAG: universal stress protein [Blastocatellia bacterium]|nr:universal stress protein [Blastocatellia bacterium]